MKILVKSLLSVFSFSILIFACTDEIETEQVLSDGSQKFTSLEDHVDALIEGYHEINPEGFEIIIPEEEWETVSNAPYYEKNQSTEYALQLIKNGIQRHKHLRTIHKLNTYEAAAWCDYGQLMHVSSCCSGVIAFSESSYAGKPECIASAIGLCGSGVIKSGIAARARAASTSNGCWASLKPV